MSAEPSMEEILSSIKRIIAEEGESPIRSRRVGRATPPPVPVDDDDDAEVLELSDPLDEPAPSSLRQIAPHPAALDPEPRPAVVPVAPVASASAASAPAVAPVPAAAVAEPTPSPSVIPPMPPMSVPEPADPILSTQAAAASRTSLDSLSRLLVKPEPSGDGTLEGMVREMLRPMLRDWLDANLPAMVETMVQVEIARISSQPR